MDLAWCSRFTKPFDLWNWFCSIGLTLAFRHRSDVIWKIFLKQICKRHICKLFMKLLVVPLQINVSTCAIILPTYSWIRLHKELIQNAMRIWACNKYVTDLHCIDYEHTINVQTYNARYPNPNLSLNISFTCQYRLYTGQITWSSKCRCSRSSTPMVPTIQWDPWVLQNVYIFLLGPDKVIQYDRRSRTQLRGTSDVNQNIKNGRNRHT